MKALIILVAALVVVALIVLALSIGVVTQYEKGVWFRLGRVIGVREPGLAVIIPVIDRLWKVSLRIVTMPIQSQGIITRDNVSVDIAAVAYFRVVDAVKSVVAIENVYAAIGQIAQTTLRKVVGQHTLDEALAETEDINADIREILDVTTLEWGVEVTLVELKDIQLPDSMKRAMARQAEAEREKRAKIIAAEGESMAAAAFGEASDTMMAHPLALQLRNLQTLIELGVDKNTTVVFPAPLMATIGELGTFFARESGAAPSPSHSHRFPSRQRCRTELPPRAAGHDGALMLWSCIGWSYSGDVSRRAILPGEDAGCRTGSARNPRRCGHGLADNPEQWRAANGSWTALDDRQLIRLLTDSRHDTTNGARALLPVEQGINASRARDTTMTNPNTGTRTATQDGRLLAGGELPVSRSDLSV